MAVTYSPSLIDDRSRVHFHLRDTTEGAGPLPSDANFADSEIDELIEMEGSWQRAVAAGFEALASAWARHPTFKSGDLTINRSDVANRYAKQATEWRGRFGYESTAAAVTIGVIALTKQDGYSDGLTGVSDAEYA